MGGIVQIRCLGKMGRFGNQCFQYAFARAYAASVGATLETPEWVGQELFGLKDAPITDEQPTVPLDYVPKDGAVNINLHGYYQHAAAFEFYTISKLLKWFTFTPQWVNELSPFQPHQTMVAHIRRGDYVTGHSGTFCIIDEQAYKAAVEKIKRNINAVQWVREDQPAQYSRPGLEWLIDFVTLMRARTLFRANSTFSWWAATLGQNKVYSPVVDGLRGHHKEVKFVKGNWPRCVDLPNVSDYHIAP